MTQPVQAGDPLRGFVNSNVWDQGTLAAGAKEYGFTQGRVTKFRAAALVIPMPQKGW